MVNQSSADKSGATSNHDSQVEVPPIVYYNGSNLK